MSYLCSTRHASPMHVDPAVISQSTDVASYGGESTEKELVVKCTQLCGEFSGRSCSKTLLVNVFPEGQPELATKVYAIIDVQRNRSLVRSELLLVTAVNRIHTLYALVRAVFLWSVDVLEVTPYRRWMDPNL